MDRRMRLAIGDPLQIAKTMKKQIVLNRASVWDISADIRKFQDFLSSVDLEKEWLIIVFSGASDEIEAGSQKGAWKVAQKAQLIWVWKRGQWTTGTECFGHRLSPSMIYMKLGFLSCRTTLPRDAGEENPIGKNVDSREVSRPTVGFRVDV